MISDQWSVEAGTIATVRSSNMYLATATSIATNITTCELRYPPGLPGPCLQLLIRLFSNDPGIASPGYQLFPSMLEVLAVLHLHLRRHGDISSLPMIPATVFYVP